MARLPVPMPRDELADFLDALADRVRERESLEGSLEYLLPADEDRQRHGDLPAGTLMVMAAIRTGGPGQGGMFLVGEDAPESKA